MIIRCVKTGYLEENCYVISKDDKCLIVDPGDDYSLPRRSYRSIRRLH